MTNELSIDLGKNKVQSIHVNGMPSVINLTEDILWRNILFKKGTSLYIHTNGIVERGTIARDEQIFIWKQFIPFKANTEVSFFDDGIASRGYVGQNTVLLHPYSFTIGIGSVVFFRSGAINTCIVKEGLKLDNKQSKPNTKVVFTDFTNQEEISVRTAFFSSENRFGNYTACANTEVHFYDGKSINKLGKLLSLTTTHDVLVQNFLAKAKKPLSFYENGNVRYLELSMDLVHNGIQLKANQTFLLFHDNGHFNKINSSHEVVVNGLTFSAWMGPTFDKKGILTNTPF